MRGKSSIKTDKSSRISKKNENQRETAKNFAILVFRPIRLTVVPKYLRLNKKVVTGCILSVSISLNEVNLIVVQEINCSSKGGGQDEEM